MDRESRLSRMTNLSVQIFYGRAETNTKLTKFGNNGNLENM
jgi:hypothetical protein